MESSYGRETMLRIISSTTLAMLALLFIAGCTPTPAPPVIITQIVTQIVTAPPPTTTPSPTEPIAPPATLLPSRTPSLTPPNPIVNPPPTATAIRTRTPTPTPPRIVVNPLPMLLGTPMPTPPGLIINTIDLSPQLHAALTTAKQLDRVTTALDFRVWAYRPASGAKDGSGIQQVEFTFYPIKDGLVGQPIYRIAKTKPPFCPFGDDGTNCIPYELSNHDNLWPDRNTDILPGDYRVQATITYGSGETRRTEEDFGIVLPPTSTPRTAVLRAKIVDPAPGRGVITQELVFQVQAYDERVGVKDGAGIAKVEMFILNNAGKIVYQRTETAAAYCAFSGGEPKCVAWSFGDHGNTWPNGVRAQGVYTLRAVVYAKNGATTVVESKVSINP